jgi:N-acetylmuramoyl-L-alanine amidase
MKFLIVAGHQGTTGAVGNGIIEEVMAKTLSDKVVAILKEQGHQAEEPDYNLWDKLYSEKRVGMDLSVYNYILEVHFNSAGGDGTEILVYPAKTDRTVETSILNRMGKIFNIRGIKNRDDLQNIKMLTEAGRNNSLLEVCFVDNPDNVKTYLSKVDEVAQAIAYGLLEGLGQTIKLTQTVKADPIKDITKAPDGKLYRVGLGAYSIRENAEAVLQKAKQAGFDPYLVLIDDPRRK